MCLTSSGKIEPLKKKIHHAMRWGITSVDGIYNFASCRALVSFMTSSPAVIMEVINSNGVQKMRELCGPTEPDVARREAPGSIRACFGTDDAHNAIHSSSSVEEALLERELLFGRRGST